LKLKYSSQELIDFIVSPSKKKKDPSFSLHGPSHADFFQSSLASSSLRVPSQHSIHFQSTTQLDPAPISLSHQQHHHQQQGLQSSSASVKGNGTIAPTPHSPANIKRYNPGLVFSHPSVAFGGGSVEELMAGPPQQFFQSLTSLPDDFRYLQNGQNNRLLIPSPNQLEEVKDEQQQIDEIEWQQNRKRSNYRKQAHRHHRETLPNGGNGLSLLEPGKLKEDHHRSALLSPPVNADDGNNQKQFVFRKHAGRSRRRREQEEMHAGGPGAHSQRELADLPRRSKQTVDLLNYDKRAQELLNHFPNSFQEKMENVYSPSRQPLPLPLPSLLWNNGIINDEPVELLTLPNYSYHQKMFHSGWVQSGPGSVLYPSASSQPHSPAPPPLVPLSPVHREGQQQQQQQQQPSQSQSPELRIGFEESQSFYRGSEFPSLAHLPGNQENTMEGNLEPLYPSLKY
jgi:hypothetical protein